MDIRVVPAGAHAGHHAGSPVNRTTASAAEHL